MWLPPDIVKQTSTAPTRLLVALKGVKWGGWSLIALYVSLLSGVIVGLQYDYSTPYHSATSIDLLAPFGSFFRSLHFFSSQFFFFFSCIHLIAIYNKTEKLSPTEWTKLIGTLPLIILLLFTGYILRGDNTGSSAGLIAENIVLAIPLAGEAINSLLFSITDSGLRKVYLHHVITLDLLLLILVWNHLRIYRIFLRDYYGLIAATLLFCLWLPAPFDPDLLGITYISGPWFFLGLQELLRYFPVLIAGFFLPLIFFLGLLAIHPARKKSHYFILLTGAWLLAYSLFSCLAWFR
ncbi:MAG: cytochrome b N-terminal domain-containing protein [Desulforhopalus sp.]